jgi:hypothetical protein
MGYGRTMKWIERQADCLAKEEDIYKVKIEEAF